MAGTKQQRQVSPLPPGRYWIIVDSAGKIADFDQWIRDMAGGVVVESARGLDGPAQVVVFRVPEGRAPFLSVAEFGYPNFAGPEINDARDVATDPVVPGGVDLLEQFGKDAVGDLKFAFLALLVLLALTANK